VKPSCHICRERIQDRDDLREVVLRNGLIVTVCLRCWVLWPDSHKLEARA
jgi:hypothetical protein